MKAIDLDYQGFVSWVAEEPSRSAKITIDSDHARSVKITIDSDHATVIVGQWLEVDGRREYVCQVVESADEIDLVGKLAREREEKREHRRNEYERMRAEFGG